MILSRLPLNSLRINKANDRHGELENETAAIAWLFNNREAHMKALARDIANSGELFETPLVSPEGEEYIVFDGNRRLTCLKMLDAPRRAPTAELQSFFEALRRNWPGTFPTSVECQVEADRDRIDEILFRRHTGSQSGVGQSTWDDRSKSNFINRTGKGSGSSVADEIELRLSAANLLKSDRKIPRSTLNRLLSSETFRNRVGFRINRGKFEFTHKEDVVLRALGRIADDLSSQRTVLSHIWDAKGKHTYLDGLVTEGLLPGPSERILDRITHSSPNPAVNERPPPQPITAVPPERRNSLIPQLDYGIAWSGQLQRHHAIWVELQHRLSLRDHPNAVSVLFRVLLELAVEHYIKGSNLAIGAQDKLAIRALKVAEDLRTKGKLTPKYLTEIRKFQQSERLFSADTLHRYIHSPDFAPSPQHLAALWNILSPLIVEALKSTAPDNVS